jgi:hypothetical protein
MSKGTVSDFRWFLWGRKTTIYLSNISKNLLNVAKTAKNSA